MFRAPLGAYEGHVSSSLSLTLSRREGGPLTCAPSAAAVAGNGGPLSYSLRSPARWRKQLRRITWVLGAVRDTDVQMAGVQQFLPDSASAEERAGVERLLLRLAQRRQALQGPVVKALERFAASQLPEEMKERLKQMVSQSEPYGIDGPGRYVYRQTRKGILKRLNAFEAYAPYI